MNDVFSAGMQRKDNVGRAAKMHAARLQMETYEHGKATAGLKAPTYVGCCGWFYWKWRKLFYPNDLPTGEWFRHYAKRFDTVEINASFYSPWQTLKLGGARRAGEASFTPSRSANSSPTSRGSEAQWDAIESTREISMDEHRMVRTTTLN